jgi:hypothetical protein
VAGLDRVGNMLPSLVVSGKRMGWVVIIEKISPWKQSLAGPAGLGLAGSAGLAGPAGLAVPAGLAGPAVQKTFQRLVLTIGTVQYVAQTGCSWVALPGG